MTGPRSSSVGSASAPARDFTLYAADGVRLAATHWPGWQGNGPSVLLLHGNGASRQALAASAGWLNRLGYTVLTLDFRGHGESEATARSFGWNEALDARAAFDWLKREQGGSPVAIIGISLGGAASLLGPDGPLPAEALVLQAVYPDIRHAIRNRIAAVAGSAIAEASEPLLSFQSYLRYGVWPAALSPIEALRRFGGAVLVIGGEADRYTPPEETRRMFNSASGARRLWLAPGADHVTTSSLATDEYRTIVLDFLSAAIGRPAGTPQ